MNATETERPIPGSSRSEQPEKSRIGDERPKVAPPNVTSPIGTPPNGDRKTAAPQQGEHEQHGAHDDPIPKDLPRPKTGTVIFVALLFVGALAGIFVLGWIPHQNDQKQANADAVIAADGMPAVTVQHPKSEITAKDVVLPCDVRANQQTALFGQANGYLKKWLVDVGAHVTQGQLMAVIDTPEVDAQLSEAKASVDQAKATVTKSKADLDVAQTDYSRYLKSQKDSPGSVTQEDIDAKRAVVADDAGALDVAVATVAQDQAEVQRLAVLQGFEQVIAPFAGTVTARNYDVGALINPAVTTAGTEIFDLADVDTLRVYVNVPQTYSTNITLGQPAYLTVRNYAKREFTGVVARTFGALNQSTRTQAYEVDFANSDGALTAGMYGTARLPLSNNQPVLEIPTSGLIFDRNGLQVAVVKDQKVHFQKISVGRDMGVNIEVTDGLTADDEVVVNPGARISEGVQVQVTSLDKPPVGVAAN